MIIQATIQKWGNSLALRLTGPAKSIPDFKENMLVEINIQEEGIHVSPIHSKKKLLLFKEKELINGLSNHMAHADDALAKPNSKEWGD